MVDEGDILDKGTIEVGTIGDEGEILDKGATKAEAVMDEGLNYNMEEYEGLGK